MRGRIQDFKSVEFSVESLEFREVESRGVESRGVESSPVAHQNRGCQAPSGASEGAEGQACRIAAPKRRGLGRSPSIIGA